MELELTKALEDLIRAFETNVRDCEDWMQYRNAVAVLRHAKEQHVCDFPDGLYCKCGKPLF